ncbi:Rho-related GTP-binding protein RhoU [Orchesella cincta]|uniref:Rho-related GTP-binding protein RhoU n=1 Tax=Orchesella cincta TaxID=48709 RepID=A0A1D2NLK1_ORCCI|nr:Rho-related GTP-binding protein RhoU [Orchesella cincta]
MEDEVASSNENVSMDGKDTPSEHSGGSSSTLCISINSSGGGSEVGSTRVPFRQLSSASSSNSSSSGAVSKSSKAGRKKVSLQRQKSVGKKIKCVLIGDSKTGKSALVRSFLHGQSNHPDYVPTTQDIHIHSNDGEMSQENGENPETPGEMKNTTLHICDTGGQQDMDRLRPLCYSQAQMVIICFNVMNPSSFANVTLKWLPEVKRHGIITEDPENPIKLLLVGTQSDLRSNVNMLLKLMDDGLAPVSEMQALRLANKWCLEIRGKLCRVSM